MVRPLNGRRLLCLPLALETAVMSLVLEAEPAMLVTRWNTRLENGRETRWKVPGVQGRGVIGSALDCRRPRCYGGETVSRTQAPMGQPSAVGACIVTGGETVSRAQVPLGQPWTAGAHVVTWRNINSLFLLFSIIGC